MGPDVYDLLKAYGVFGGVGNYGTGTMGTAYAGNFTITNWATGQITDGYGVYIASANNHSTGAIVTNTGLHIADQTAGTTNYAIYTNLGQVSLGDNVDFRQGTTISTSVAGSNLTFDVYGDIILDPNPAGGSSSGNVLPGGSVEDNLGDYNRMWRTLYAAELYVQILTAQQCAGYDRRVCPCGSNSNT